MLKALTPVWTVKPETARRLKQRIKVVLAWAKASGSAAVTIRWTAWGRCCPSRILRRSTMRRTDTERNASSLSLDRVKTRRLLDWPPLYLHETTIASPLECTSEGRRLNWTRSDGGIWDRTWSVGTSAQRSPLATSAPIPAAGRARIAPDATYAPGPKSPPEVPSHSVIAPPMRNPATKPIAEPMSAPLRLWLGRTLRSKLTTSDRVSTSGSRPSLTITVRLSSSTAASVPTTGFDPLLVTNRRTRLPTSGVAGACSSATATGAAIETSRAHALRIDMTKRAAWTLAPIRIGTPIAPLLAVVP